MLTPKQEAFVQAVVSGMNQSDAYRHAYDAGNMKPATVSDNAYTLANHTEVAPRIEALKQASSDQLAAKRLWTQETFLDAAEEQRLGAVADHQWAPANGALKLIGDATGLLSSHVDVTVTHTLKPGLTLEELEARMQRLAALEAGVVEGEAVVLEDSDEVME